MRTRSSPSPTRRPTPWLKSPSRDWPQGVRSPPMPEPLTGGFLMSQPNVDRRLLLGGLALAGAAAGAASAQAQPAAAAATFNPQALPFDPKSVPGLSEKLLTSHHDNNYVGAVKRIGAIRAEVAKLDLAT